MIYPTEPMFQDGIVAQAVDDVAAAGISHFSSAGNRSGWESYDSAVRIVPGRAQSWANTNLDFSGVDPALYAGGFHDFDDGPARDVAQTIQADDGSLIVFQWNEPFDPRPPAVVLRHRRRHGHRARRARRGRHLRRRGGADWSRSSSTATRVARARLTRTSPSPCSTRTAEFIQFVDNTTNPESLTLELPATGTYFLLVDSGGTATGSSTPNAR